MQKRPERGAFLFFVWRNRFQHRSVGSCGEKGLQCQMQQAVCKKYLVQGV